MAKIDELRAAGLVHPTHEFTAEETRLIESLSDDEVKAMASVKKKLGHKLITKKTDDDTHPDTIPL
jgi:hypothetical protein